MKNILSSLDIKIKTIDLSKFSKNAETIFQKKIFIYKEELFTESIKDAKRFDSDGVSAANVKRASQIIKTSSNHNSYLSMIGGILFGVSLSSFLAMQISNEFSTINVLISAVLGIVGAFMIALQIGNNIMK